MTSTSHIMYLLFWFSAGLWNVIISTLGWHYLITSKSQTAHSPSSIAIVAKKKKTTILITKPNHTRLRVTVFLFGLGYASMCILDSSIFLFWCVLYAGIVGKTMVAFQHFYDLWRCVYQKQQRKRKRERNTRGGVRILSTWTLRMSPLTMVIMGDCCWVVGFCFMYTNSWGQS